MSKVLEAIRKELRPVTDFDRWRCSGCGECCTGDGKFLELGILEYVEGLNRYFPPVFVEMKVGKASVLMLAGQFLIVDGLQVCPYLVDDGSCDIYHKRPRTCRAFPFGASDIDKEGDTIHMKTTINKICRGIGQGGHVFRDGVVRPDIVKYLTSFAEAVVDLPAGMTLGEDLRNKGWLVPFTNKGELNNYIVRGRLDIPISGKMVPMIPYEVVWRGCEDLSEVYGVKAVTEAGDTTRKKGSRRAQRHRGGKSGVRTDPAETPMSLGGVKHAETTS